MPEECDIVGDYSGTKSIGDCDCGFKMNNWYAMGITYLIFGNA